MPKFVRILMFVVLSCLWLSLLIGPAAYAETVLTHAYTPSWGPEYVNYLTERAAEFTKSHPGVRIDLVNGGDTNDKVLSMIVGGTPPDVTDYPLSMAGVLALDGYYQDLTEFIKRDKISMANYPPYVWNTLTLDNGAIWGFPADIILVPTYYNVDYFAQGGLRTPNELGSDWTWETLVKSAKKLTLDTNGDGKMERWGLGYGGGIAARFAFIGQAGGKLFDNYNNPKVSMLDTPAVALGCQWFSDLFNVAGVLPTGTYGKGADLASGLSAIDLASTVLSVGTFNKAGIHFDMAPQPKGPGGSAANTNVNSMQMIKDGKNKDLTWQWIKYIATSPENLQKFSQMTGRTLSYLPVLKKFSSFIPNPPAHMMDAVMAVANEPAAFHAPLGAKAAQIITLLNDQVLGPVRDGVAVPIATTLQELHRQATEILKSK